MALYGQQPVPHQAILTLFYPRPKRVRQATTVHWLVMRVPYGHYRPWVRNTERTLFEAAARPDFNTNFTASQFLTEVQGGSDVGANAVQAEQVDGQWRITGEKWFCSNADADVFLLTARVSGPETGTRGLGLFLIPRLRANGEPNGFRVVV